MKMMRAKSLRNRPERGPAALFFGFFFGNPEADRQNRSLESAGASTANCSACSVIAALTTSQRLPRRLSLAARRRWAIWVAWPKALLALRLMG